MAGSISGPSRRSFLMGAVASLTVPVPLAWAGEERQTIAVLTNHNDDTFSLFEEAFERAQSRYRLKSVWLMPPDAMKSLRRTEGASPDVWWQAAPHNHLADLAKEGLLQPLGIKEEGLPSFAFGSWPLAGERDFYRASQLTAFAFLVNRQALQEQKLSWPED